MVLTSSGRKYKKNKIKMSAPMLSKYYRLFRSLSFCQNCRTYFIKCTNIKPKPIAPVTLLTVFAANKTENVTTKLKPPDPSKLTHSYLIKTSASQTIDSVTTLITQTALAILEIEAVFKESADLLSELLEYQLTVIGNETEENRVWDVILAARAKLNTAKHRKQELDLLLNSVEKLVHDAGEVAFIAGSEYSAICSAERLQSAKVQINQVRELSAASEKKLQQLEILVMEATMNHEEEKYKKEKERKKDFTEETEKNVVELEDDLSKMTEDLPT